MVAPGAGGEAEAMNTTTAHSEADNTTAQPLPKEQPGPQTLCRPVNDRMVAGVAAGIANYLAIDVTLVRIVVAVLAVAGGFGIPLYIAGWLLIPEEGRERSIAEEFIHSQVTRAR
jgi:phage shock protein PspC (stress-responsive transcriptional regulator)